MSWSKVKVGVWGDTPQDEVDIFLEKRGFDWEEETSPSEKRHFYRMAKASRPLRAAVNRSYQEGLKRNATQREFSYLIKTGLRIDSIEGKQRKE